MKTSTTQSKKIFLVGGGSGGHLTPLLAVADALKTADPDVFIGYIGQKNELLGEVLRTHHISKTVGIAAGKFRRYHGTSKLRQALDLKTLALNTRDFFLFIVGIFQSLVLLKKEKPDSIFLKGGFVCVPVGIAAKWLKIPYITHDSDAIPGLANRLTAKAARYNTTALEPERYPYDQQKAVQVGIPLQKEYQYVDKTVQQTAKETIGRTTSDLVLVCVGGGLGARNVNTALIESAETLLVAFPNLHIYHFTGKALFEEVQKAYAQKVPEALRSRVHSIDFSTELYTYTAAADVAVARAGATNIAELSMQAKAAIIVPNPLLTGGQQLHNAAILAERQAAIILHEEQLHTLADTASDLLKDSELRTAYANKLHNEAIPDAAEKIATLLYEIAQEK